MAVPEKKQEIEEPQRLSGTIERVLFHNAENGYSVLAVRSPGEKGNTTVVGTATNLREGETVEVVGAWHNDPKFGQQFKADQIQVVEPTSKKGILRYLSNGAIKGIGPAMAQRLVNKFGDKVFEVIEKNPQELVKIQGIGKRKLTQIVEGYMEQRVLQDIMVFLQTHGIGPARSYQIYKKYKQAAIAKIKENPYRLCQDIQGIGFKMADSIAASMGTSKTSPMRAEAGVLHVMNEMANNGHCAVPYEELHKQMASLLEVPAVLIETSIDSVIANRRLLRESYRGQDLFYLSALNKAERGAAKRISTLLMGIEPPWGKIPMDQAIAEAQDKTGLQLAPSQVEALKTAIQSKVCVITGGPGVGKTTILKTLLAALESQRSSKGLRLTLCAPTGRAAKRMSEATGMDAATIHRTLGFNPQSGGFVHNAKNPLPTDLVVIDESSMPDISLTHSLLDAIPEHAAVIFLGDIDQLPSVGPGSVLKDMIESRIVPTVRLTEIFRQAQDSKIITNAHRINQGQAPLLPEKGERSDFYMVPDDTPEKILARTLDMVTNHIPKRFGMDPINDIQVLVPMHKGPLGTKVLNIELQKRLNPTTGPKIERFGMTYAGGDKVMQTVNNYEKEVFNGDIGRISSVDEEEGMVMVNFEGRDIPYERAELDELTLAYATTIHKSQGSEYPAVVMPLSTQHHVMLERNLLYTGVTRGKQLVVLNCQPKALDRAINTVHSRERRTTLAGRMQDACPWMILDHDDDQEDDLSLPAPR